MKNKAIRSILVFTLLLSSTLSFGQKKYKQVKRQINRNHKEIYQVDKKSKTREGYYYIIKTTSKDTLITGQYENDKKTGIWKYYNKNSSPLFEYNYDTQQLKYDHGDNKVDSTYIQQEGTFKLDKVDHAQVYLGYENQVVYDLIETIRIPREIMDRKKSGSCLYSFIISKEGKLTDIKVEQSFHQNLDKTVFKILNELNYEWCPAKKDGTAIDSKSFLFVEISNTQSLPESNLNKAYFWHIPIAYFTTTTITTTTRRVGY